MMIRFLILTLSSVSLFFLAPATAAAQSPVKVYILAGQSNMQGHAHVRTLEHVGMDSATAPLLNMIQQSDGQPRTADNVWISYLSSGGVKQGQLTTGFGASEEKIGPELTFGLTMAQQHQGPVLIIKTAWGGKSLNTDFRSPSAGPYEFSDAQREQFENQGKDLDQINADKQQATGHYYRLMIEHVNSVLQDIDQVIPGYEQSRGYELAGFVWFQGWNDMVDRGTYPNRDQPNGYQQYSDCLEHLIHDVRKDLKAPELPIVVGVMGVGGPVAKYLPDQQRYRTVHQNFRDAQAAPAKSGRLPGKVVNVLTEQYWDLELRDLKAREGKLNQQLRQQVKANELDREQQRTLREKLWADEFSEQELKTLQTGVSNAEYHYLGSAKIMAQIGAGFAQALKGQARSPK